MTEPLPPRVCLTKTQKTQRWNEEKGLCWICGKPVAAEGPTVRWDHRVPRWITQSDDPKWFFPIHTKECDSTKTYKEDLPKIAKIKRIIRKADPETRKKSKRPIPSRGFDKTKTRTFSGKVKPR